VIARFAARASVRRSRSGRRARDRDASRGADRRGGKRDALLGVSVLASDILPRRALAALGHVQISSRSARSRMLMVARSSTRPALLNPLRTASQLLENLLAWPSPVTA
jgi:hypothetical protein